VVDAAGRSAGQRHLPTVRYFRAEGGNVKEHWGVTDTGAMMMQMGAMG
jgi:hypothetical protein